MKRFTTAVVLGAALLLGGCASRQQLQSAVSPVDTHWGDTNQKLLRANGQRYCNAGLERCFAAASSALQSLGFAVVESNRGKGLVRGKASGPTPFNDKEWTEIRQVEEPMAQAMAANHVGSLMSKMFLIEAGKSWVYIIVTVREEAGNVLVATNLQLERKEPVPGMIVGTNPPSEAVRRGLVKWWAAFDRALAG